MGSVTCFSNILASLGLVVRCYLRQEGSFFPPDGCLAAIKDYRHQDCRNQNDWR